MDSSSTKAGSAVDAGLQEWTRAAEEALRAWRGEDASLTLEAMPDVPHASLAERFPGRAIVISFTCTNNGSAVRGALICEEAAALAALGLDAEAPLAPVAEAFAGALARSAESLGAAGIAVGEEHCVELTSDGLASLRTALPAEPLRLVEAAIHISAEESLIVGVAFHDEDLGLGQELSQLARMGVGRDAHGNDPHASHSDERLGLLMDVDLPLIVRLGESQLTLEEVLRLRPGSVIELNRLVNEPVELIVNNRTVAYGEVVVVHENFGLRVTRLADGGAEFFS